MENTNSKPNHAQPTPHGNPNKKPQSSTFGQSHSDKRPFSETIKMELSQVAEKLRDHKNLSSFLEHLEKVEEVSESQLKWNFRHEADHSTQGTMTVGFNVITTDNLFTWTAQDKGGFAYTLEIQLSQAQAGRGTVARLFTSYDSKAGAFVGIFEKLFGADVETLSKKTLQRFKAFCETGSVPTTQGQPSGRDGNSQVLKH